MGDIKRLLFASFLMRVPWWRGDLDVIWERREGSKSQYKGRCTVCGKTYLKDERRTVFVLKPEGTIEKLKPFFFVTSCPHCADETQETLQKIFGNRDTSLKPLYRTLVRKLLRKNHIIFNEGQ